MPDLLNTKSLVNSSSLFTVVSALVITTEVSAPPEAFSLILGLATVNARAFVPLIELAAALN